MATGPISGSQLARMSSEVVTTMRPRLLGSMPMPPTSSFTAWRTEAFVAG